MTLDSLSGKQDGKREPRFFVLTLNNILREQNILSPFTALLEEGRIDINHQNEAIENHNSITLFYSVPYPMLI